MEKRYLVRANGEWAKTNLKCNDFEPSRIPQNGEEWEVTEERLHALMGNNKYNKSFVDEVETKEKELVLPMDELSEKIKTALEINGGMSSMMKEPSKEPKHIKSTTKKNQAKKIK